MRTDCQEDNCFIWKIIAKTEFTIRKAATFLTDDKNNTEIPIYPRTSATYQIEFSAVIH
jgi:hypothetical protein